MADRSIRTLEDLDRTVRALATEFKTDKVFIIGSQGILLGWPDAPTVSFGVGNAREGMPCTD